MDKNQLFGITIPTDTKKQILEKIKKNIGSRTYFFHIVSLNPEIMVIASQNPLFKKVVTTAQMRILDGVGIVIAAQMLNLKAGSRLTGVDLMEELVMMASNMRLRVMLIGGKQKLADSLAKCYNELYPEAKFKGVSGITDIKNPKKTEENEMFSIVAGFRPQIVLVSFGSPDQELWIERHKNQFKGMVVAGVGGAFNYLNGDVIRAPLFLRYLGLEWLFRLMTQPWRWRRQLRLIEFIKLAIQQKWKRK
jgi:N-acetylglucosaminyldiphosphoundecaprenol N-acetyl-beta-D-mannosaminyltransferase